MAYRQPKLEDIWDSAQKKLLVLPVEAKGLAAKDSNGTSDPYIKLLYGKETWKTSVYKKTLNPVFPTKELFLVRLDGGSELNIELWDKDKFAKDDFLGIVSLGRPEERFQAEKVHEEWFDLKPRPNKKKDIVSGRIKLRFYLSTQPETRPESSIDDHVFYYEAIQNRFKSGDVILLDGSGLLQSWTKILSNSTFSSVGLVIELPNKWTRKKELYLLEVTRNVDHFLDAFKEVPTTHSNICIFRLFERIHQFHGNSVHYLPLRAPLTQTQQFYELMNGLGSGQFNLNSLIRQIPGTPMVHYAAVMDFHDSPLPDLVEFLQRYIDKQVLKTAIGPNFLDVAKDVYSAKVILRFLQTMGKPLTKEPERIWPVDIAKDSDWFESPILIREKRSNSNAANLPPPNRNSQGFINGITQYAPPSYLVNTAVAPNNGTIAPSMYQQQQQDSTNPSMMPMMNSNSNYSSGGYSQPIAPQQQPGPQQPISPGGNTVPPPYFGTHHTVAALPPNGNNGSSAYPPQQPIGTLRNPQEPVPPFAPSSSNYPTLRNDGYPPQGQPVGTLRNPQPDGTTNYPYM